MSRIVAELGPTNTGKTHRAVERLLEHESGMMGLPLRLLAREVYDRITARIGEGRVALLTGEEKRIPAHASYWICTVEAMPVDRAVDFLAVDEIQLAAHRERGHVFTDRLLHARGRRETWFLGAETMRPMVHALLPEAQVERSTRLSRLRYAGRTSLKALPPRSVVVAFSLDRVYELAESLRRLRGGVAVVLGALSPRTRNAQVAMYQAGEVQYLVATDAIGMGLNLDVNQVVFAETSKYDGAEHRPLWPDELGQIAGRAGRHLNDGTFGTLNPLPELSPHIVTAIETHRFTPVRSLIWRNRALDFDSPEALLDSLARAPEKPAFVRVERADDFDALKELSRLPEVRELASSRAGVELLWEVCQVPDFRKRWFGQHVGLLREIFLQLARGSGQLETAWLDKNLAPLEDTSGDIHALMDRLAGIRIWTYVAHRARWLAEADAYQARTRRIEDALGDALHARLVERFVERAARRTPRRFTRERSSGAKPVVSDSPFAKLRELGSALPEGVAQTEEGFVSELTEAAHTAFGTDALGRISYQAEPLARLVRGSSPRTPQVTLLDQDAFGAGARRRVERRLQAFARDLVAEAAGGFLPETFAAPERPAAARGLAYRLAEGLGIVAAADAHEQWHLLDPSAQQELRHAGLRTGREYFHGVGALSVTALERRALLMSLFEQAAAPAGAPREAVLNADAFAGREALAYGYRIFGALALRLDMVERLSMLLADRGAHGRLEVLWRELRVGAARAQIARELGPQIAESQPPRRRSRGRGRRSHGA